MQSAVTSILEAISSECIGYAAYSLALGFLRLAEWEEGSAAQAFTAAALFGAAGVATGLAGRAVAPKQAAAGTATGGGAASTSPQASAASLGGSQGQPGLQIYVQGSIYGTSGVQEICDMLNDAVKNRDVTLYATQVKNLAPLVKS